MSSAESELLPTRLFRAAQGNRAQEAAVLLLTSTGVLSQLGCCIILDVDRNLAWVDWPAVATIAGRARHDVRAILLLASTIATQAHHIKPNDRQALRVAVEHLSTQRLG